METVESIINPQMQINPVVIQMADRRKSAGLEFDSVFRKLVRENKRALDILSKQ